MKFSGYGLSGSFGSQKGKKGRKSRIIFLEGAATIDDAAVLAEFMLQAVSDAKSLIIDLNKVKSVDVSFFQILLAMAKTCSLSDIETSVIALPDEHIVARTAINAGFSAPVDGFWFGMACISNTGADS
ncbi:MAG TPA: STAS domain-containing protein [Candidatus Rifleibacterium sp.]|nr:STAS domain-containing protein [Candidatus Rifleibacterium sp.]